MQILIAEDDRDIADLIVHYIQKAGWQAHVSTSGDEALAIARRQPMDLVVLDVMLPGLSGLEVCRALRADKATAAIPIIMVTARAEETDRIIGLEIGADDYVSKPFSPRELLARIKSVLRRAGERPSRLRAADAGAYAFGSWVLRTGERELIDSDGVAVPLSTGEYNLLLALVTHARRVLTRDQLLDLAEGRELAAFERSVDNMVSRLRRKIEPDPRNPILLKTVRGGGYMLAADVRRP